MIGVIAAPEDQAVVREFFELFKTPWEPYRQGAEYSVVVCAGELPPASVSAGLLIVYAGSETAFDATRNVRIQPLSPGRDLVFLQDRLPIYGPSLTFAFQDPELLKESSSGEAACYVGRAAGMTLARVGYDLFAEVRTFLVKGQPAANAAIPALELHIELLRNLINCCGVSLIEIPAAPQGYPFIVCLTHDLDHALVRRHKFDSTMVGFLYRATVGSALNLIRGRMSARNLFKNVLAAARLPFVFLGLAKDFWYQFDRYLELEGGRPSTFFVIPFERFPGRSRKGTAGTAAPSARGAGYDISHIREKIPRLIHAGCEVGLHGIDAWGDSSRGKLERQRISEASGTDRIGLRMHWLYSDENSPRVLEEAGFEYDSTVGYNETVGYRAGTGQAYKPLIADRLMELPLQIMDTALFYPDYLDLSPEGAWNRLSPLFANAVRLGGTVTVNWHDRSIAPERLWGDFYVRMLKELSARGACFLTAAQAVHWFRRRRSVTFQRVPGDGSVSQASVAASADQTMPALRVRSYRSRTLEEWALVRSDSSQCYVDVRFDETMAMSNQTETISFQN